MDRRMSFKIYPVFSMFANRPSVIGGLFPLRKVLVIIPCHLMPISGCLNPLVEVPRRVLI